jgi:predicted amidohydrolase YtcJ
VSHELLIVNGKVWTGDPAAPTASAVAIRDNRIAAVGGEADARGAASRDATVIDAGGRTVLPGLIDAHNHYLATAEALASVNVRFPHVASRQNLTRVIGEVAEVTPPGRWIRAVGLDWSKFPDGQPPTRDDLDAATLGHPVIVYHVSVHHALVNTPAMRERGITDAVTDPPGGRFVRDTAGRLTGLCLDAATDRILPVVVEIGCHGPNFHTLLPGEDSVALLKAASPVYLAAGLTTVCDPQVTRREMRVYCEATARGVLGLRVALMPLSNHLADFEAVGIAPPFGDDHLRIAAMKLYADGTLIGGTAWFTSPYGPHGEFTGSTYWPPEALAALVARAHRNGWQVGIHTQGDAAIGMSLDAIEGAMRAAPRVDTRHRIEHCGYPRPDQIDRMANVGVIPINQPNFLVDSGDDFLRHLGERAHRLQPLREELDAGIRPVLSSDAFVSSHRPLDTIGAAMTRQTRTGVPIGADQRLTLDEALRAHTLDAAAAIGMEDRIGSLQPGKLADIAIVDGVLHETPADQVPSLSMWMTILDGEVAWSRPGSQYAAAHRAGEGMGRGPAPRRTHARIPELPRSYLGCTRPIPTNDPTPSPIAAPISAPPSAVKAGPASVPSAGAANQPRMPPIAIPTTTPAAAPRSAAAALVRSISAPSRKSGAPCA